ncbi:hybrid sensor histidine kinase/response regulator [Azospirillum picis]|uniref:histidine kinase n=1 Tax=Azospirillum picis TaxID=488438 RepID=A0ABU0MIP7_9PROT|nr:hybrid sensor histidine kinase/response regulator [Azospirillum picis]MBP2299634.1 two-component system NtrC family sensor kinase [Azospirillum picis]MDQ0533239.1 two-component system NtrC family sensor kinase [Azospirillum picis]
MALRSHESWTDRTASLRLLRLLLAVSVALPLVLFAGIGWRERWEAQAEAEQDSRKNALILHEHVLKVFDTVEQVLDRVDERIRGRSWAEITTSESLHGYLRTLAGELEQIGSIGLADPDGVVRNSSIEFPSHRFYVGGRTYFRLQRESDAGLLIGETLADPASGRPSFGISRRRSGPGGPDGGFDGVINATVNPAYFASFYRSAFGIGGQSVSLVREDGLILMRFPPTGFDAPVVLPPDRGLLAQLRERREEGIYRTESALDGRDRLYAYRRVGDFPVYVVYGLDQARVITAWWRNMAMDAAFVAPATLALALIAWLAYGRAVSENAAVRRWAEETRNRERLEEALRQSQKMEALGQLTGGVAHDFNNLLTAALANLHLLSRHLPTEAHRYLDGARTALERAEKLTRQLLAFSRQDAVNPALLDLGDSLRRMGDLIEHSVRGDVALDWDLAPGTWTVAVDPIQLEMAVLNLVVNARDAMPEGGRVRVALTRGPSPRMVRIEVVDTGTGMAPDVAARAFDPFFTTKAMGKGTGLGLSMVYGFARQSGGNATIESRPGAGTRVMIDLPLAEGAATAPAADTGESAGAPADGRGLRVLVVEDNALVLLATVEGLVQDGFTVETAEHGVEALDLLERDADFDIVVSDVVMPHGVSGIDLARRIRERWPRLPVLLASGYSPESLSTMGADLASVLPKPYTPDQLAARIRALTSGRVAENQAAGDQAAGDRTKDGETGTMRPDGRLRSGH